MKNKFLIFALLVIASCSSDVKEDLGLKKTPPDEFAVAKKPKLEIPPEFKIRPPEPDTRPINDKEVREQAREILTGKTTQTTQKSLGENALLEKTGATSADPKIRETLNDEYGVEDPTALERIRTISDKDAVNTLVDPKAERDRIIENKQQGKSVAEGEIKTKPATAGKSVIEKVLGD